MFALTLCPLKRTLLLSENGRVNNHSTEGMQMSDLSTGGYRARVESTGEGVSIHIAGLRGDQIDADQLTSCVNTLLSCAGTNACFDKGFSVGCVETVTRHHRESNCISSAFGLAGRRQTS